MLSLLLLFSSLVFAEPAQGGKVISELDHPPKLIKQARLHYPQEALAEELHGDVILIVTVDEMGEVIDVKIETGLEVFHQEASIAARRLKFDPAMKNGIPVVAQTRVIFHFAPHMHEEEDGDFSIVVEADSVHEKKTQATETLSEEVLEKNMSLDLSKTISEVAGVQFSSGNSDNSKPIIRGQTERRLLLIQDGIRHASQKWGIDHAPEIDPFAASEIEIIKGASGVRYGADAIGGVILLNPPKLGEEEGFQGKMLSAYSSNGAKGYGAGRVDWAKKSSAVRVEGNFSSSADVSTPNYILGNTASQVWNLGGAFQQAWGEHKIRLNIHQYHNQAGVFYGIQSSTIESFQAQIEQTQPEQASSWIQDREIDKPYQDVDHLLSSLHWTFPSFGWFDTEVIYAFQRNHRQEYEQARESVTEAQYDFQLHTHSLDLHFEQYHLMIGTAEWENQFGVSGLFQKNIYQGLPLIPNFRNYTGGAYAIERLIFPTGAVELGIRGDLQSQESFLGERDFQAHVRRGTLSEEICTLEDEMAHCPISYSAFSSSLGGLWQVIPNHMELKLDLSLANRFPNADELYMLGTAPTFPVFAFGDPTLGKETQLGISPTLGFQTHWLSGEVSGFSNWIEDFIYFAPEVAPDGSLAYEVTIRGAYPRYRYSPVPAWFYGVDGSFTVGPELPVSLQVVGSLVRGENQDTGEFLVGIPSDRLLLHLQLEKEDIVRAKLTTELVREQFLADENLDFAPAPDGYMLLHGSLAKDLKFGENEGSISLIGSNLLNQSYRNYNSLLRYYADEKGRDLRLAFSYRF